VNIKKDNKEVLAIIKCTNSKDKGDNKDKGNNKDVFKIIKAFKR